MENPLQRKNFVDIIYDDIHQFYSFDPIPMKKTFTGVIHRAHQYSDHSKRIIKTIAKTEYEGTSTEVNILRQMDHPNLVRIYEVFEDRNAIHIVMEHCVGGNLLDFILNTHTMSERLAGTIFQQICSAALYLHRNGIIHRNLKLELFMFRYADDPQSLTLIDLGVAKADSIGSRHSIKGTTQYMPPESFDRCCTEKYDAWSLGVIMYTILSGSPPFNGKNQREIIQKIKTKELKFVLPVWVGISDSAKELLIRLLDKDPESRMSTSEALAHSWVVNNSGSTDIEYEIQIDKILKYSNSKTFRKTVLNYMATQCTPDEIKEFIRLFRNLDTNSDGELSCSEFCKILETSTVTKEEILKIFDSVDLDRSGTISLNEFLGMMIDERVYMNETKILLAFDKFDVEGSGSITLDSFRKALDCDSDISNQELWRSMMAEADLNNNGEISYEEFAKMVRRVSETERKLLDAI